jgi:hypothetical protein
MPWCGVTFPRTKSLIVSTLLTGLVPVIGGPICHTAITGSALSISSLIDVTSLAGLIVLHKLESFLSATHRRPHDPASASANC